MIFHSIPHSYVEALADALQELPGQCLTDYIATLLLCLEAHRLSCEYKHLISAETLASALEQVEDLRRPGFTLDRQVALLKGALRMPLVRT